MVPFVVVTKALSCAQILLNLENILKNGSWSYQNICNPLYGTGRDEAPAERICEALQSIKQPLDCAVHTKIISVFYLGPTACSTKRPPNFDMEVQVSKQVLQPTTNVGSWNIPAYSHINIFIPNEGV
jgi:hypothetical protein